ncbi:hypothetical protein [Pyxidicoccus xibeiensis]|uniref:hypothetical protein n=1 Tax=Pyxidicoccus xibeiensis TaxID=2906759 RepID=UPI0020A7A57C|nr:hypothetical protein [Pyxidicoccus xibeiensis]MCP3144950.1 hypothetical protein [Pyxidicoccus xibeiensis]
MGTPTHTTRKAPGGPRGAARWRLPCLLALLTMVPAVPARAAEPSASAARCSKPEFTKSRRSAEKLYREGRYAEAVDGLRRTKESCWSALDATDRGWLVSDLGLAALRAGQPELCRQVLDEAPTELDPESRVAKAIAHNRGLCQGDGSFPVWVDSRSLRIASPQEAAAALARDWNHAIALREGRLPQRKDREVNRCTETEGVKLDDLDVTTTVEIYPAQAQLIRCRVLKLVAEARPAKVSHLRDLLTTKALGKVLPADFAPAFASGDVEEHARAGREGKTWSDIDPKVRFEPHPDRATALQVEGDMESGVLELCARGDFNGDGIEDAILDRNMRPEGGSLVDMTTFLVTRTRPGGVLTLLERMD